MLHNIHVSNYCHDADFYTSDTSKMIARNNVCNLRSGLRFDLHVWYFGDIMGPKPLERNIMIDKIKRDE